MGIRENLAQVRENMALAAEKAGRNTDDILLVGATKMNDAQRVQEAISCGLTACGENRVQEMLEKNAQGAYAGAELHFIGHLQKNKVNKVVGLAKLIHSADSLELLSAIDRSAGQKGLIQDVLLEINIGEEEAKSGFTLEEIPQILAQCPQFANIKVRGLMAVPPICREGEENRWYFDQINHVFVDNQGKKYDNVSMDFMSVGMSGDYMTAIECGANIVRIGSAIFGARDYGNNK